MYRENWDNVQISFFDPGLFGNMFFNTNGQNFLIKGIETSLVARVTDGLTLQGAASWNQSKQTNSPALIDNNPQSADYGKPITQDCDSHRRAIARPSPIRSVRSGRRRANAPPMQFSLRARYEWSIGGYHLTCRSSAAHSGAFIHASGFESDHIAGRRGRPPAGCVSRIPLIRPSMPQSASRRMPGT